ncbi:MAG: hypothetical protein ONB27_03065 [candidate division KSB1 bacterium]|nr:hypothetical protein [candidate division KSB1 bacterium]
MRPAGSKLMLLLKVKMLMWWNSFYREPSRKRGRKLLSLAGAAVLFVVIYQWLTEVFLIMAQQSGGDLLMNSSMIMIFGGFFIFLLASGITISLHYLFIASDLPLLITSPLSSDTIFTFKLLEAIIANSTFFLFMGLPTCIVFGYVNRSPWYYYPLMGIDVLLFLSIPVAISFLGALILVRLLPASRAKELSIILLAVITLAIWLTMQLIRGSIFDQQSPDFQPALIESMQRLSKNSMLQLLPGTWAAQILAGIATNRLQALWGFLPLVTLNAGLYWLCLKLSRRTFQMGSLAGGRKTSMEMKGQPVKQAALRSFSIGFTLANPIGAICARDFKLFRRDTRQLVNILLLVVMMVLLPIVQPGQELESEFAVYYPYLITLLFSALVSGQMASRLIPLEARTFWITRLLPQSSLRVVLGKFLLACGTSTALSWLAVLIVGLYFHHPLQIVGMSALVALVLTTTMSAVGLYVGAQWPRFDWDHPKRMLTYAGSLMLSLATFLVIALMGIAAAIVFFVGQAWQIPLPLIVMMAIGLNAIVSAIIIVTACIRSAKKIDRIQWEY